MFNRKQKQERLRIEAECKKLSSLINDNAKKRLETLEMESQLVHSNFIFLLLLLLLEVIINKFF